MIAHGNERPDFDALWDYDNPAATEAEFRKLLLDHRANRDPEYQPQLLTQIARAQGLQMKFEEADATLDQAEALITEESPVARVRLLLERGRVRNSSQRREESKAFFLKAWDRAREIGADAHAVDAAHMLGIVEPGEASVKWNRTAIEYAEKSQDLKARRWLGSLYNNLGWTYHGEGEYEEALALFQKALAAREAEGKEAPIRIARWCVARATRSLGRFEEALEFQLRLKKETEAAGAPDGFVEEEIGECLLALERAEEAKPHFAAAYRLLSQDPWLKRDQPERLERLRDLGDVPAEGSRQ